MRKPSKCELEILDYLIQFKGRWLTPRQVKEGLNRKIEGSLASRLDTVVRHNHNCYSDIILVGRQRILFYGCFKNLEAAKNTQPIKNIVIDHRQVSSMPN